MPSEAQHLMARMLPCGACGADRHGILVGENVTPDSATTWFGKCTRCGTRTAESSTIVRAFDGWQSLAKLREERDSLLEERGEYRKTIRKLQGLDS